MDDFDPYTHTGRDHPDTSFEAAESLVGGGARIGILKMLWGWYDLGWAGGNYKMATDAAAERWEGWNRDKASPRSTDCKQKGYVDPVLDECGNHKKTENAYWFRISPQGCIEIGVPYPFGSPEPPPDDPEPEPSLVPADPLPPKPQSKEEARKNLTLERQRIFSKKWTSND